MGPIQLFGKIAAVFLLPGLAMLGYMMAAHLSFRLFGTDMGAELIKRPFWVITSFMLIFLAVQLVSMGLLAEIQIRTYHEAQDKKTYHVREKYSSGG